MKATEVKAVGDYKIRVVFDDGISGIVDLSELTKKGIFQELRNPAFFAKVYTTGEAISWSDDLEIDALNIYAKIIEKDPAQYSHTPRGVYLQLRHLDSQSSLVGAAKSLNP